MESLFPSEIQKYLMQLVLFLGFSLALLKLLRIMLRGAFGKGSLELNWNEDSVSLAVRSRWGRRNSNDSLPSP